MKISNILDNGINCLTQQTKVSSFGMTDFRFPKPWVGRLAWIKISTKTLPLAFTLIKILLWF